MLPILKWIIRWMQEAGLIYEDYVRKIDLRRAQFPTTNYEIKVESSKIEVQENLKNDPEEKSDLEGDPDEVDKELEPDSY
ncbi:hypothetical protein GOBAR_DD19976 [Gossypium barbadense]|nr:hypothetical protein GOBAR_DD19976 [Gossypium barbadense]